MLTLARRERETLIIDGKIRVTIVQILGDVVKVGIQAPADVLVLREELANRIEQVGFIPGGCLDRLLAKQQGRSQGGASGAAATDGGEAVCPSANGVGGGAEAIGHA